MLSYPVRWVLTAVLILAYLTQSTHATAVSLLDLLPKCASRCVESFISAEYPRNACSKGCDLNYLCTTNTTNGYTLGEAALRCSLSLCSVEVAMSFDSYSICDSVPDALPRTHATIIATVTATANPTSTTTPTVITAEPDPTSTRTTSITSTETDHTSRTTTTFQSPTSTTESTQSSTKTDEPTSTTSTESSPSPTSSEAADDSSQGSNLNSGAVIGVSVASGIAGFFIIGVIIFFCCRRMRRKAQDREFFEIGGHMEEPPDFSFPPTRPPKGPRPSPQTFHPDIESVRLVQPEEQHPIQYPAVVVTQPEEDSEYRNMSASNTDRGVQSAKSDYETASIASSRTVSDLLPDKPTYELYPRPLRWSQHKRSRPSSGATVFEEENYTRPRPLPTPPLQQSGSSLASTKTRGQNRHPAAGLPANPRAMMYGFGSPGQMGTKSSGSGKRPAYAHATDKVHHRETAMHQTSPYAPSQPEYDDDIDNYWKGSSPDTGFVGAKVIQPQPPQPPQGPRGLGVARSSYSQYPGYEFEFGFGDIGTLGSDPRRASQSRHSGGFQFRPLTPVREIRTPMGEAQNPMGDPSNNNTNPYRRTPSPSKSPCPYPRFSTQAPQEIVSRPRVVRQDDIKRVEIRRGKPSPREVTAPYCPDDYWQEQLNESSSSGYNASRSSGEYIPMPTPTPKPRPKNMPGGFGGMPRKKPAPAERNLTPSRRGADLILQVE